MSDHDHLVRAAALAAPWMTFPNPRVGCVLVSTDGVVVGEGAHHHAGGPHAEVAALAAAGEAARGSTAYVTLEPCAHTGRTGPCADALIAAGVARVVIAVPDPNPVAAGGIDRLRAAGIAVDVMPVAEAEAVNEHWLHAMRAGRPFVTLKLATSIDGRVAAAPGVETRISNDASRARVHQLRATVDAILVGATTAVVDDPDLTVRFAEVQQQPQRFVMGMRELPAGLRMLQGEHPARVLHTHEPREALAQLHGMGIRHVLLEGGPTIARAFVEAELIDECIWITAPVVLGAGPLAMGEDAMSGVHAWRRVRTMDVEGDLWSVLRP